MHILLDCDGVLANFTQASIDAHGRQESHDDIRTWDYFTDEWGMSPEEFWSKCRGYDFWRNIQPYEWAQSVIDLIRAKDLTFTILTAPSNDSECVQAKLDWLDHHFSIPIADVMVGQKKHLLANPEAILIDDSRANVDAFIRSGGKAALFLQPWNSSRFLSFRKNMEGVMNLGIDFHLLSV